LDEGTSEGRKLGEWVVGTKLGEGLVDGSALLSDGEEDTEGDVVVARCLEAPGWSSLWAVSERSAGMLLGDVESAVAPTIIIIDTKHSLIIMAAIEEVVDCGLWRWMFLILSSSLL